MEPLDKIGMGSRIKQIRKRAGMRQWQLAKSLGTTQSAVHKYERGVIPEPRRLIELSRIGNTSIEWILTGRHWENGSEAQERPPMEVFQLAERLQSFQRDDQLALDEALHVMGGAIQALRTNGGPSSDTLDLAEKEKKLLLSAQRIHRAVLESVLEMSSERLDTSRPADDPQSESSVRRR
jgi:transcriptional regulator with XRE-family HTH domain